MNQRDGYEPDLVQKKTRICFTSKKIVRTTSTSSVFVFFAKTLYGKLRFFPWIVSEWSIIFTQLESINPELSIDIRFLKIPPFYDDVEPFKLDLFCLISKIILEISRFRGLDSIDLIKI